MMTWETKKNDQSKQYQWICDQVNKVGDKEKVNRQKKWIDKIINHKRLVKMGEKKANYTTGK